MGESESKASTLLFHGDKMPPVVVDLTLATICFMSQCHPILFGKTTPVGEFQMIQRITADPGYGGDVIQFHETDTLAYSIHRTWNLKPQQNRNARYRSSVIKDRIISSGCINVEPAVYEQLVQCCSNSTLIVKR